MSDNIKMIRWDGIVEDRNDPFKTGGVRVRIFNPRVHPWLPNGQPDTTLVPTDKLPVAQVKVSPNQSRTTSVPVLGEWVTGYFLDGENKQMPIIDGTYGGITSQIIIEENGPRLPDGIVFRPVGEPITPRMSRGVMEGTQVDSSNQKRSHVCNIYPELELIVGQVVIKFNEGLTLIRNAIRALLSKLGLEPSGEVSWLYNFLKWLAREIRKVLKVLQKINEVIEKIRQALLLLAQILAYILSLAAKLLAFLRECLREFLGSISSAVGLLVNGLTDSLKSQFSSLGNELSSGSGESALNELITAAKDVRNAATEVANGTLNTFSNAGNALGDMGKTIFSPTSQDLQNGELAIDNILKQTNSFGQDSLTKTKFDLSSVTKTP
jgi:signal transduction histidine kinase